MSDKSNPKKSKSGGGTKNRAAPVNQGKSVGPSKSAPSMQVICQNRKVKHHYEILDTFECGMILLGSEVKSLRAGKCQVDEAYGRFRGETLWLIGCNIAEYPQASVWNHEPKRQRQLLIKKREIHRFLKKAKEKGSTLIPLRIYFNQRGIAKCEMALCRGLKLHDKREKLKAADARRDMERAVRRRR